MPKPNLDDLDYDALTELIDEATNLRTTKFEGRELHEKRRRREPDVEAERKVDPFTLRLVTFLRSRRRTLPPSGLATLPQSNP